MNLIAGWLGLVHIALGTAIFSALLFVSAGDAGNILLQYLASGTICRLIIYFEIAGMRKVEECRERIKWIVQFDQRVMEGST